MNPPDTERERACGADVAAYALGALEPAEAEAFRRHLESCSVCAHELASFRRVVNELPLSTPRYQAPPQLRGRVLSAVAGESRPDHGAHPPRQARRAWRSMLPRLRHPAVAIASASGAIAVIVAATLVLSSGSGSSARVINAQVTGPGRAVLRVVHGRGELIMHGVSAPPRGKIYEVWVKRDKHVRPTSALFSVTTRGDGDVDVPGSLDGVSRVMVTPEPLGGSRIPTHAPVITASLT